MEGIRYYNRYTGREEREQVPGEKYMQWIYGTASGKAALHVLIKRGVFSRLLGWLKNRPSSARSIPSFVEEYGINMEDSLKGVGEFRHFNDFFYRRLKPGARPLAGGEDTAVFPADARHMGWERADRIKNVFVKGQRFDLPSLLGSDTLAERYAAGAVVLSRLCPTDYHRFHFPVSGVPGPWTKLGGPLPPHHRQQHFLLVGGVAQPRFHPAGTAPFLGSRNLFIPQTARTDAARMPPRIGMMG